MAQAADFADNVNWFLRYFGLKQEAERVSVKAQAAAGEAGSRAWFLAQSDRGEHLLEAGHVAEAAQVFQTILNQLGESPSYERAVILGRLGRCFRAGGRPDLAIEHANEAIAVCDDLKPSDEVRRLRGSRMADKAEALADQGRYAEAREGYQAGLKVAEELDDLRKQGVILAQIGTLALQEGNLPEGVDRFQAALVLFQQLREPAMEAVAWHQLGMAFQEAWQWDEAERRYREAARIKEASGDLAGAAGTWNQLAIVNMCAGKLDAAEMWFRKAIGVVREVGDRVGLSASLGNLANLLQAQPGRLTEARQVAEEALGIMKMIECGAAGIWKMYNILAAIADRESEAATDSHRRAELLAEAREHRRLAREAKRNFAGTRHELRRRLPLIVSVIMAVQDTEERQKLERALPGMEQRGWTKLVAAIRRVLAGERDADALCENLDLEDSMIVETILQGLADPSTLADLFPPEQQP